MADFKPTKTQLRAMEENGLNMNNVENKDFGGVREYLERNNIVVTGRTWKKIEDKYDNVVDGFGTWQ